MAATAEVSISWVSGHCFFQDKHKFFIEGYENTIDRGDLHSLYFGAGAGKNRYYQAW